MISSEERNPVSVCNPCWKSRVLVGYNRLTEDAKRAHFEEARRTTLKHVGTSEKEFQAYCRFTAHLEMIEKSRMLRVTYEYTGDKRQVLESNDTRQALHG